ncbi:MAG: metallophosphoesterase [Planctomycetota bacterium]
MTSPAVGAIVREPYLQLATPTSITVVWRTDLSSPSDSRVEYGTDPGNLDQAAAGTAVIPASNSNVKDHIVTITGLSPATVYFYNVGTTSGGVAGGGTVEHYFVTSPAVGTATPLTAWILGDSGTGTADQTAVRDAMLAETGSDPPDVFLHLGDMAYEGGTDAQFTNRHFAVYRDILRHTPLWPCVGNHEASQGVSDSPTQSGPYYEAFVLPTAAEAGGVASTTEAYYSFDQANVHFIVLDSDDTNRAPGAAMSEWLVSDLLATTADWVVAFFHHPPYTKANHDSDNAADSGGRMVDMREDFLPILEAGGVDLVLTGHSHAYERSCLIDGVYGYGGFPDYPTPSFATLMADGHIIDPGDGDPAGDGAYTKDTGLNAHDGAVYVVAGHGGRTLGNGGTHPVMYFTELEYGSCLLTVDGDTLSLRNVRYDGTIADRFSIVKRQSCNEPSDCDDADLCTIDDCVGGFCEYTPVSCPAGEVCDPASGFCLPEFTVDHVLVISIDGLRSDALTVIPPTSIPNLVQLSQASSTLNGRTVYSHTTTLPNHVSMLTSRPVEGAAGHGWTRNTDPLPGETLHTNLGEYVAGAFDVAHDNGLYTALYAGKSRFSLFDTSWDDVNGAPDVSGANNGRDKIDSFVLSTDFATLTNGVIGELTGAVASGSLVFLHYAHPDTAGHSDGWDLTPGSVYVQSLIDVDGSVGQIMGAIRQDPALNKRTAVVLTTDHGGSGTDHHDPTNPLHYTIPFAAWVCDGPNNNDLYALNPDSRTDPGSGRPPDVPAPDQPIRNADAGNLALDLLGLPTIPDSAVNAQQDLAVFDGLDPCGMNRVRFVATADSRSDGENNGVNVVILGEIVQATLDENADFFLFPGDLVLGSPGPATFESQLTTWRDTVQPLYDAGIGVYPVRGNHEMQGPDPKAVWDNVFSGPYALPGNGPSGEEKVTYSFTHNNVFVAGLDQYVTPHRVNQAWLDVQFATGTPPHVFVYGHEPAFKVNHDDCLDDFPSERNILWFGIEGAGGRTYLSGHDHFYDHARLDDGDGDPDDDLHQLIISGAGAPFHPDGSYDGDNGPWTPQRVYHEAEYGYLLVEIDGLAATLTWKHRTAPGVYESYGGVLSYVVQPGPIVPPDSPTNLTVTPTSASQVDLSWVDNSDNESGFQIDRSTSGLSGPFTLLATVGADTTTHSDIGLDPSTQYCFRVRAVNFMGPSSNTIAKCATTLEAECQDDPDCDDGVGCTDDTCQAWTCVYTPNDVNCEDGLHCNGAETCDATLDCQAGTPVSCDDSVGCTDDSCNETTDTCDNLANDGKTKRPTPATTWPTMATATTVYTATGLKPAMRSWTARPARQ